MRDMISNLKLKLEQTEEDVSCPAIYRLRAKLRELMKGQSKDESIESLVRSSESCEALRLENERLLAELEKLQRVLASLEETGLPESMIMTIRESMEAASEAPIEMARVVPTEMARKAPEAKSTETTTVPEYVDVSDLLQRLKECEEFVADLKMQLEEKDRMIESLEKELDSMISQKGLADQIEAMKLELKRKDDKVSSWLETETGKLI